MRDDFLTADWSDGHAAFSGGVDRLLRRIASGFVRLQQRRFHAPWRGPAPAPAPQRVSCG